MSFKIPPYNHCDYRCDRCDKRKECTVFKRENKQRLEHILKGENSYSMETVMDDVGKAFQEASTMIHKFAEREGIDIERAMANYDGKEEKRLEEKVLRHPFHSSAKKFFKLTHNFLTKTKEKIFVSPEIEEYFNELDWYHTLIPVKAYRALSMYHRSDSVEIEDSLNNTKLVLKAIGICRHQLERISYFRPKTKAKVLPLLKTLDSVEKHAKKFMANLVR